MCLPCFAAFTMVFLAMDSNAPPFENAGLRHQNPVRISRFLRTVGSPEPQVRHPITLRRMRSHRLCQRHRCRTTDDTTDVIGDDD